MKVGLVYSPMLNVGGVERHLLDLIPFLISKNIAVLLLSNTSQKFRENLESLLKKGVELYPWMNNEELNNIIFSHKPDLIHFHSPAAALSYLKNHSPEVESPIIETRHLSYSEYFSGDQKTFWRKLRAFYYTYQERKINQNLLSKCIFVSQKAWKKSIELKLISREKAVHIPNTVDINKFKPLDLTPPPKNRVPVLICTGRLDKQKGQSLLIEALRTIKLPWELWLVGTGPQENFLKELSKKYNLDKKIRFWGYREDIPRLLAKSDIFILPSLHEAAPYSLLEAMASGLPCIATSVGDVSEWIQPQVNGLLVPPGKTPLLMSAILKLLEAPSKWEPMGQAAAEKIRNHFSPQKVFSSLLDEYKQVLRLRM